METKPWYLSKTILVQLVAAACLVIAAYVPSVAAFLQEHFAAAGGGWALINIVVRALTKKEIA